jgi:hypothetical protein
MTGNVASLSAEMRRLKGREGVEQDEQRKQERGEPSMPFATEWCAREWPTHWSGVCFAFRLPAPGKFTISSVSQ